MGEKIIAARWDDRIEPERGAGSVARHRHRSRSFPTLADFGNPPHVLAVAAVVFHEGTTGHRDAPAAHVPRDLTMRATETGRQEHVERNLVNCGRKDFLQRSQRSHVGDCSAHCNSNREAEKEGCLRPPRSNRRECRAPGDGTRRRTQTRPAGRTQRPIL